MSYPENLRYSKEHEWIRDDGELYTVGITSFAAEQLGDVTFVDLPKVGAEVQKGGEAAAVESVKAASDVYSPAEGTVVEVNEKLEDQPELVNNSPYEDGWFYKLKGVDASDLEDLMEAGAYEQFVQEQDH